MTFVHRDNTYIRLGPVEAYAGRHRRVMTVVGSAVVFSLLGQAVGATPDALRALREGDRVNPSDLDVIIPSMGETPCAFMSATPQRPEHELSAVIDDIVVRFSLKREIEPDERRAEAELRGVWARFVVTMLYPPQAAQDESRHRMAQPPVGSTDNGGQCV